MTRGMKWDGEKATVIVCPSHVMWDLLGELIADTV